MHACQLVDLAAVLVQHAGTLLRGGQRVCPQGRLQLARAEHARCQAWQHAMWAWLAEPAHSSAAWPNIKAILEEVLLGDLVCRAVLAVLPAHEPLAMAAQVSQTAATTLALQLLRHDVRVPLPAAVDLNRLRYRAEWWTDWLLSRVQPWRDVTPLAWQPARVERWTCQLPASAAGPVLLDVAVTRIAARVTLGMVHEQSPFPALNAQLGSALLACLELDFFDAYGVPRTKSAARCGAFIADAFISPAELAAQLERVADRTPRVRPRLPVARRY